jgi:hypothetical protein
MKQEWPHEKYATSLDCACITGYVFANRLNFIVGKLTFGVRRRNHFECSILLAAVVQMDANR